ncbi:MAG: hypothetical protein IKX04_08645 [Clostridiales bacterium]|nr:hypothetical protein [Lachnospiraceae bacterium]MBR5058622.1 hypothetical protein [Clostridiales bacterium]
MENNNSMIQNESTNIPLNFEDDKVKTAYALNLVTVSVSQIIDYNDIVILEQEYDTILNNLNLENMPKDEALLNILKQLLDTITFFRIQEGDKKFIDLEYQHKMKNAIWSAIPGIGLFVGKTPVSLVMSLASQVGIGYMNYRKQKAENKLLRDKQEWQLRRTAIEQFNGLRRELFDTAWRLVDAYDIPDEYRLTERQVTQYNEILMDADAFRRYERLDSIKDKFIAYPPFWYFFGNTANELWKVTEGELSDFYFQAAKMYFEVFIRSFKACDLLRENQVASSCALEYIDLLRTDIPEERAKIDELIKFALDYSGNANDVLQLCAFSYLKIGEAKSAALLFRRLVNEDYNAVVNAQLLSRYYVSAYLNGDAMSVAGYQYLEKRMDEKYLYPFPDQKLLESGNEKAITEIESSFIDNQKKILNRKFAIVIDQFRRKYEILFNKCVPVPDNKKYSDNYFNGSVTAYANRKADGVELKNKRTLNAYNEALKETDYPYSYLPVLNDMVNAAYLLNCVQGQENMLLKCVSDAVIADHEKLKKIATKVEKESFEIEDYDKLLDISFGTYTDAFFEKIIGYSADYIAMKTDIVSMNEAEGNLRDFCIKEGFESPEVLYDTSDDMVDVPELKKQYLGVELIDDGKSTVEMDNRYDEIAQKILQYKEKLMNEEARVILLMRNQPKFDRYFIDLKNVPDKHTLQRKTVAILDDGAESDSDLLFTTDGLVQIVKGKMKEPVPYDDIKLLKNNTGLQISSDYENDRINMEAMIELIQSLRTDPVMKVVDDKNPVEAIFGFFKF